MGRRRPTTNVRLSDHDAAALDEVAAWLHLHGDEPGSRALAIRALIRAQRERGVLPTIPAASQVPRDVMAQFWRYGAKERAAPPWPDEAPAAAPPEPHPPPPTRRAAPKPSGPAAPIDPLVERYRAAFARSGLDKVGDFSAEVLAEAGLDGLPAFRSPRSRTRSATLQALRARHTSEEIGQILDAAASPGDQRWYQQQPTPPEAATPLTKHAQQVAAQQTRRRRRRPSSPQKETRRTAAVNRDRILAADTQRPIDGLRREIRQVLVRTEEPELSIVVTDLGLEDLKDRAANVRQVLELAKAWHNEDKGQPLRDNIPSPYVRLASWYHDALIRADATRARELLRQLEVVHMIPLTQVANRLRGERRASYPSKQIAIDAIAESIRPRLGRGADTFEE